ncbi:MAG: hypothetical protein U0800_09405 [Isosphaeraceae bacterium]
MAADKGKSEKPKTQHKPPADPKAEAKAEARAKDKAKKAKAEAEAKAEAKAAEPAKPEPAAPRPPADPRLKVMKKFEGRFLPKGPLRDRYKAIRVRWDSEQDNGGVTVEELKGLLNDWRASRAKPTKAKA